MGKIPRLPKPRITKARHEIRNSVKKHKAGNTLAQQTLKILGKPKNTAERRAFNKTAFRSAIVKFASLKKAAVEALKKA